MQKGREVNIPATEKQQLAWKAWLSNDIDDVVYGGAAGGGKSMLGCQVLTGYAIKYPGTKYYIGREELKNLMLSTYATLTEKVFPQYGLERDKDWWLDGKYNIVHFKNGSTINLLDLKAVPTDPLFNRFGSHEYTCGWIEEASEAAFRAYDVLKSRVGRWKNKEYGINGKTLITLNPSQDWPYRIFYDPWKKAGKPVDVSKPLVSVREYDADGKLVERKFVFIPALYRDNPFTSDTYSRQLATISDPILKARLMNGDWEYSSAKDTLFDAASIADLFTNKVPVSTDLYMTVDVARFGGARIVRTIWRGWDAFRIKHKTNCALTETADDVRTDMDMYGIPRERVLYDADGVGGSLEDLLPGIIGFHGGAAPFGKIGEMETKENYDNLRAQCAYHLADRTRSRSAAVSEPDIEVRELLSQELAQIKRRDVDKDGKLKIAKKEDIIDSLGRSPDFADTFIMRSYFDLRLKEPALYNSGIVSVFIPED